MYPVALVVFALFDVLTGTLAYGAGASRLGAGGAGHDTFDPAFRRPTGAVSFASKSVMLRLNAPGANRARIRVWDAALRQEAWKELAPAQSGPDTPAGTWELDYPIPHYPTILYYLFEA